MPQFTQSPAHLMYGPEQVGCLNRCILKTNIRAFFPSYLRPMTFAELLQVTEVLNDDRWNVITLAHIPKPTRDSSIQRTHYACLKCSVVVDERNVQVSIRDDGFLELRPE
ncbi:hypothetical protein IAR50_006021 [Cryptococcus sp. DSM 104548]